MIICFPHKPGFGGPGSFQNRFERSLKMDGEIVTYRENSLTPDVIFIVGGTGKFFWLLWMKLKGIPIIFRLDGINWLHRKKNFSFFFKMKAELIVQINKFYHAFLADAVIYQSKFVEEWWEKEGWIKKTNSKIIYNGVAIQEKSILHTRNNKKRLVILEGKIDYTPYAIKLMNELAEHLPKDIEIELYGGFEDKRNKWQINNRIKYFEVIPREKVLSVLPGSVFLSLDINPACPNTVLEAMSCGAPVVAFDTGALSELISDNCGRIVPYGGNPWNLDYPDVTSLSKAIIDVINDRQNLSENAYRHVSNQFNFDNIFKQYIDIIYKTINNQ